MQYCVLPGLVWDLDQALRSVISLQNPLVTAFRGVLKGMRPELDLIQSPQQSPLYPGKPFQTLPGTAPHQDGCGLPQSPLPKESASSNSYGVFDRVTKHWNLFKGTTARQFLLTFKFRGSIAQI